MKKKRILIIGTSIIIMISVIAGLIFFTNGTKNKMVIRVDGWDMEYTEPKGRVKGISIGKGQAFHGIGDEAEKDFEDLELLELLETARAQETEDLEFRSNLTSQQVEAMEAYEDFRDRNLH